MNIYLRSAGAIAWLYRLSILNSKTLITSSILFILFFLWCICICPPCRVNKRLCTVVGGWVLWWGCWWIAAYHEVWTPLNPGIINSSYLIVCAGCQQRAEGGDWGCLPWKGFQLCCLYRIYFSPLSAQSKWHDRKKNFFSWPWTVILLK